MYAIFQISHYRINKVNIVLNNVNKFFLVIYIYIHSFLSAPAMKTCIVNEVAKLVYHCTYLPPLPLPSSSASVFFSLLAILYQMSTLLAILACEIMTSLKKKELEEVLRKMMHRSFCIPYLNTHINMPIQKQQQTNKTKKNKKKKAL